MCREIPCYAFGKVVEGFGRGSKALGIPTANLPVDVVDNLPSGLTTGIYYGWAFLRGHIYKMVTSVGWNPFYKNEKKSMEVHILNKFTDDFYGEELKVIITGYIRPEKDFPSVEALIKEIQNDIAIADRQLDEPSMLRFKNDQFFSGSAT